LWHGTAAPKVERLEQEDSVDHALAALLVKEAAAQTPFVERKRQTIKGDDTKILVRVFAGKKKAAIVFKVDNQNPYNAWRLTEARLFAPATGEEKPFALRTSQDEIVPGASGYVAIVADKDAFSSKSGPVDLVLQLFRQDGLLQAYVALDQRLVRE
jgi:ABC-type thiamine transport system substrate-binding protein